MAYLLIEENDIKRLEAVKRKLEEEGFVCINPNMSEYAQHIPQKKVYTFEGLEIDTEYKKAMVNGKDANLTPTEFKILSVLLENKGKILSAEEIYNKIWNMKAIGTGDNTIAVHIRRIRKKIEANPQKPFYIKSVWGVGYRVG